MRLLVRSSKGSKNSYKGKASISMATAVDRDQSHTTEDLYGVRWGRLKPVKTEHYTYYESFYLDGVEYRVNDAVYLHARDGPPYIAQIAKLRQNIVNRKRTMLVRWFFRPCELPPRLPDVDYSENSKEIFMAAGSQHTKSFQNPVCLASLSVFVPECFIMF